MFAHFSNEFFAVVDFDCLSEDFSKLVFLLDDRTVEFHARYGFHYRVRF
jgi:ribosome biogenesis protein ENP2